MIGWTWASIVRPILRRQGCCEAGRGHAVTTSVGKRRFGTSAGSACRLDTTFRRGVISERRASVLETCLWRGAKQDVAAMFSARRCTTYLAAAHSTAAVEGVEGLGRDADAEREGSAASKGIAAPRGVRERGKTERGECGVVRERGESEWTIAFSVF